jgi:hypothetical protein
MQKVKKIWNASGKRQAMSRGANEKPRVSLWKESISMHAHRNSQIVQEFTPLPVADAKPGDAICHLDDDELSAALHLTRFTLPDLAPRQPGFLQINMLAWGSTYACSSSIHASSKTSHDSPDHHLYECQ